VGEALYPTAIAADAQAGADNSLASQTPPPAGVLSVAPDKEFPCLAVPFPVALALAPNINNVEGKIGSPATMTGISSMLEGYGSSSDAEEDEEVAGEMHAPDDTTKRTSTLPLKRRITSKAIDLVAILLDVQASPKSSVSNNREESAANDALLQSSAATKGGEATKGQRFPVDAARTANYAGAPDNVADEESVVNASSPAPSYHTLAKSPVADPGDEASEAGVKDGWPALADGQGRGRKSKS
jgi:hypothetical protein